MPVPIDILSRRLLSNAGQNGAVCLMYHSICQGNSKPESDWTVAFDTFKRQLDVIADYDWTSLTVSNYAKCKNPSPRTVILTFDDGYENNFPAVEELAARGMTATWYVVTNDIGRHSSWKNSGQKPILNATQLIEMASAGMEIGSHSCTHPPLNSLCTDSIREELYKSKITLETTLNQEVTSLAYPYGIYNSEVVTTAKELGYTSAVSTHCGFGLVDNNPLLMRRVTITAKDTPSSFARKLAFADNNVGAAMVTRYGLSRVGQKLFRSTR